MFEDIDLKIADEKTEDGYISYTTYYYCTRTGCYGTTCKWPC